MRQGQDCTARAIYITGLQLWLELGIEGIGIERMRIKKAKTEKRAVVAEGKEATATVKSAEEKREATGTGKTQAKAISKAGPRADAGAVVKQCLRTRLVLRRKSVAVSGPTAEDGGH